ncbi:DNA polymerase III subunit gamma/tau [Pectinatus frisingensis]|uniref:DNA polymerase III subunit gamma/tau n=1 Tax=Pectinatus frisingensis TaxID=865 RepID=UPI0018C67618|nr:DNA polymerase III subunit gamma/tau [Pectinatus frisingensis]
MAYIALYRKWRPKDFADLVGQDHISHTLAQAIKTGKIGHAYLFSGPRGTGKTSTAKIMAKALNCEHGPTATPCNKCANCQKINNNTSMDVYEIDAASNRGIDEIRDLRETVKFAPVDGRYKVYIIDEVHMLTAEAFNALLKTLEEPPAHVVFILATTEIHKVPATIQSRCQRYDFKRITKQAITKQLQKITAAMKIQTDDEALDIIAVHADGGMRDALSMLDQCTALSAEKLTADNVCTILGIVSYDCVWQLTDAILENNTLKILKIIDDLLAGGMALNQLLLELTLHWRALMIYKATGELSADVYHEDNAIVKRQTESFSHTRLASMIEQIYDTLTQLRWSPQPRITVEMALMKLCVYPDGTAAEEIAGNSQLRILEEKVEHLENIVKNMKPAAEKKQSPANITVPTSTVRNDDRQMTTPKKSSKTTLSRPVPSGAAPDLDITVKNAADLWKAVLTELENEHKKMALACIEKAQLRGIENGRLTLAFKIPFLKARTEQADYKNLLEDILLAKSGHKISLLCVMDSSGSNNPTAAPEENKPQPKKTNKTKTLQEKDNLSQEEKVRLETAVKIFGDNIVEDDD